MAGRPREFDRDKALANARDAFWARGYEGTSMADLVAALGIASARIYAAFGSKRDLFQEAVGLYEAGDGGVATRALGEAQTARQAIEKMLFEAIENCTRPGRPQGCMIVSAATNCTAENDEVLDWLAERRMEQTERIIARLEQGVAEGELKPDTDTQMLGDYFATIMRGLSVQARDGVASARLIGFVPVAMQAVDAALANQAAATGKE